MSFAMGKQLPPGAPDFSQEEHALVRHRVLLLVATVVLPLFSLYAKWAVPTEYDPLWQRLVLSFYALALLGLSFVSPFVVRNLDRFYTALNFAITAQYFYVTYLNHFDGVYTVAGFVLIPAISVCFSSRKSLILYATFVLLLSLGGLAVQIEYPRLFFLMGLATILSVSYFSLHERIATLESFKRSKKRYRDLIETSEDLIWSVDKRGRWTFVNHASSRIYGYEPKEMIGRPFTDFQSPSQAAKDLKVFERILAGENKFGYETEHFRKDGTLITLQFNAIVLHDEDGNILGTTGTASDITERKKGEAALREGAERFQQLTENSRSVFWMREAATNKLIYMSPAFEDLWGISLKKAYEEGMSFLNLVHPEDKERVLAALPKMRDGNYNLEYRILRPDGTQRWVSSRAFPVRNADGFIYRIAGITEDCTERKISEENLTQTQEQLLQSQKLESIGKLAGGIAHDFNNLLTVILGYAEELQAICADNPAISEKLETIIKSTERGSEVTRQLLDFARKGPSLRKNLRPLDLIEEVRSLLLPSLDKTIAIRTEFGSNLWNIGGDATQMIQVLMNLGVNARDAMPEGGDLLFGAANVIVDASSVGGNLPVKTGKYVRFSVRDTGSGIPKEIQNQIFDPFFTTKDIGKGTGLGLAMVYGIIQNHNGCITVESEPNMGTVFHVYIPALNSDLIDLHLVKPSVVSIDYSIKLQGQGILIADDEEALRALVGNHLRALGARLYFAENGVQAVEVFRNNRRSIDAIILDVGMPKMNGVSAYREIRKLDANVQVLFVSGYSEQTHLSTLRGEPNMDFIEKPYELKNLVQRLGRRLRKAA